MRWQLNHFPLDEYVYDVFALASDRNRMQETGFTFILREVLALDMARYFPNNQPLAGASGQSS